MFSCKLVRRAHAKILRFKIVNVIPKEAMKIYQRAPHTFCGSFLSPTVIFVSKNCCVCWESTKHTGATSHVQMTFSCAPLDVWQSGRHMMHVTNWSKFLQSTVINSRRRVIWVPHDGILCTGTEILHRITSVMLRLNYFVLLQRRQSDVQTPLPRFVPNRTFLNVFYGLFLFSWPATLQSRSEMHQEKILVMLTKSFTFDWTFSCVVIM